MTPDTLIEVLDSLPHFPQRQDSTLDQLRTLIPIANKLGCYDAANYLRIVVERH